VNDTPRLTVFYDGGCPLCQREIAFYRRRRGAEGIAWQDVSAVSGDMAAPDLTRAAALGRFHVRDAMGNLHSGGAGFARLWRELPGFSLLGRLCLLRPVVPVVEAAYRLFLRIRPTLQKWLSRISPSRGNPPRE
jgi:predicted DCC family thiol-disulfide oxidoreductase YuxK